LSILPWPTQATEFESKSICAGHYLLKDLGGNVQGLLSSVLTGWLETPLGRLKLHACQGGRHSAHFTPFHDEGLRAQNRLNVLVVHGARPDGFIRQPDLDWELKAAEHAERLTV
jgi:hypothetical protein